jgi:uncharacterized protein (DUF2252 family)
VKLLRPIRTAAFPIVLLAPLAGCAPPPVSDPSSSENSNAQDDELASSRTSTVVTEITNANAALSDAIRVEKYAAMKTSPFAFFRGSNHLYWKDHGSSSKLSTYGGTSQTRTWLAGDMHTDNTGAFDDDQGDIVFGINDFDEAVIGDYQLDVFRMAISLVLVARQNGGFSVSNQGALVDSFTEKYLDAMASYAGNSGEVERKFLASNTYGLLNNFLSDTAADDSRVKMLDSWTVEVNGVRALDTTNNQDLAPVSSAVSDDITRNMASYQSTQSGGTLPPSSYFKVKSVAERLHAGLGSLGKTRYYVLIEGATTGQDDDRILDIKAQGAPSALPYISSASVSLTNSASLGNMAYRTILAYKALGYRVDDHLGFMALDGGKVFSVRERSPWKETFDSTELTSMTRFTNLAEQWGELLSTHHARGDKDWDASILPHSVDSEIDARTDGDHAGVRAKVRSIALSYADQVKYDYDSFLANF